MKQKELETETIFNIAHFSSAISVVDLKIVKNKKKGVYFSMIKLFLVENGYFHRCQRMNIERKGIA